MGYAKYLRISPASEHELLKSLEEVENQAIENFSSLENGDLLLTEIINLFYSAFMVNDKLFIDKIFFANQQALRLTRDHQDYLLLQFDQLKTSAGPIDKHRQIHLVNLYRSIVADLYDPYLSIIVACLKLKEQKFESFTKANLSSKERAKVEFISSRLKGSLIYKGYVPLIRNAVSHSGTDSVRYEDGFIVFKNIDRSPTPIIKDVLKLSNEDVWSHIRSMIDFITAVNAAMNIFGLDACGFITSNPDIARNFADQLADVDAFEKWRMNVDQTYAAIWSEAEVSERKKMNFFAEKFAHNCQDQKLPAKQLIFKQTQEMLIIEVPVKLIDWDNEQEFNRRLIDLLRYAVIAEPLFHFKIKSYLVIEISEEGYDSLQVWAQGKDLNEYNLRKANMYDLIHDSRIYKNRIDLNIEVDFNALDQINSKVFDPIRPGKIR